MTATTLPRLVHDFVYKSEKSGQKSLASPSVDPFSNKIALIAK